MERRFLLSVKELSCLDPTAMRSIRHAIAWRRFRSSNLYTYLRYTLVLSMLSFTGASNQDSGILITTLTISYCLGVNFLVIFQFIKRRSFISTD